MKKQLLALLATGVLAIAAYADPIQIAYSPVLTQPSSNGDGVVKQWVIDSIATFNLNDYPGAPVPTDVGSISVKVNQSDIINPFGNSFGTGVNSILLDLSGYNYIVMSWGNSQIPGDNGTADYLYYINGTSSWTFFNSAIGASGDGAAALAKGGLSSITVYGNPVPDSTATLGLLVLGLVGLGLVMRRRTTA